MIIPREQLQSDMTNQGYVKISGYFSEAQLQALQSEAEHFIVEFYTPENLANHSAYPSDESDTRVSHAVMISEGESSFPRVSHNAYPTINQLLVDHNQLLAQLTGVPVASGSRCMLNYQRYLCGSKPVGEHFDGEYLQAQKASDGVEFQLLEGILPRYVAVLVVENENNGQGIEIVDNQSKIVHSPRLHAGDLILFDNIFKRHRVPRLERPRVSIGLRSFDHCAWHFAATEQQQLQAEYQPIAEGWVSADVDCQQRLHRFFDQEWPAIRDDYTFYV